MRKGTRNLPTQLAQQVFQCLALGVDRFGFLNPFLARRVAGISTRRVFTCRNEAGRRCAALDNANAVWNDLACNFAPRLAFENGSATTDIKTDLECYAGRVLLVQDNQRLSPGSDRISHSRL